MSQFSVDEYIITPSQEYIIQNAFYISTDSSSLTVYTPKISSKNYKAVTSYLAEVFLNLFLFCI